MITMPSDVLAEAHDAADPGDDDIGYAWDGRDGNNPNKQTTMDWAEHQRIVAEARGLLGDGKFGGEMEGRRNYISGDVRTAFKQLYAAYAKSGASVVRVSKGIHQPTVDPHLQLRTSTQHDGGPVLHHKFHLNVSAEPVPDVDGLGTGRFIWKPVQFAMKHLDDQVYRWPRVVTVSRKDPARRRGPRVRRLSISTATLQAHMDVLAEQQAAAEEAKREAAAAAARQLKADNFEAALATFAAAHGPKSGKINATQGVFPSDKFKAGTSTARVQLGGGVKTIKYDREAGEIKIV
jgi:hypothetical protein